MADIDRSDASGAVLEHTIRKAAGRGADVETIEIFDGEAEELESALEFFAAAAHEARFGGEGDLDVVGERVAGFSGGLPVDANLAGEDETLGEFARVG